MLGKSFLIEERLETQSGEESEWYACGNCPFFSGDRQILVKFNCLYFLKEAWTSYRLSQGNIIGYDLHSQTFC